MYIQVLITGGLDYVKIKRREEQRHSDLGLLCFGVSQCIFSYREACMSILQWGLKMVCKSFEEPLLMDFSVLTMKYSIVAWPCF